MFRAFSFDIEQTAAIEFLGDTSCPSWFMFSLPAPFIDFALFACENSVERLLSQGNGEVAEPAAPFCRRFQNRHKMEHFQYHGSSVARLASCPRLRLV
jgi:hypothetical protein